MSQEKKSIFRKSSMDRISSPEQLNEYIRVVTPSVWIILGAIIALLLGVVAWGVFGKIESSVKAGAVSDSGGILCWLSAERAEDIKVGMPVEINGEKGTVGSISDAVKADGSALDSYAMHLGGFEAGDFCRVVAVSDIELPDGVYSATITTESISPIEFITN